MRGQVTVDETLGVDCLEAWVALPVTVEAPPWITEAAREHIRHTPDHALTRSLVKELA